MKNSTIALALTVFIVATPMLTECKSKKVNPIEIVRPHTHLSEYSSDDARGLLCNLRFNEECRVIHDVIHTTKRMVIYLYPMNAETVFIDEMHTISLQDNAIYNKNNITLSKRDCTFETVDQLKKLKPRASLLMFFGKDRWYGNKSFSLISDTNKIIDIYVSRTFGCDGKYLSSSHEGRIAILIDEKGYIVSILDDVKSEKDIFNAFGVA